MKTNSMIKLLVLLPILLLTSACASITRGSNDSLLVNSTPPQASVKVFRINGEFSKKELKNNQLLDADDPTNSPFTGKTPASFSLARKGEYKVVIEKEGFKDAEIMVSNKVSGAGGAGMAGNLLFGGIIGAGVDASTGAMKDLTPNPIDITLEEDAGSDQQ